jgi:MFS family permease
LAGKVRSLLPELPRPAWIVLGGDLLSAIGTGMTLPFFIVYLHHVRGFDLGVAELALATIAFASLAGNPTGGFLTDRFGSRPAVVFAVFVTASGTASIAFVTKPWQAFVAAAATGYGLAVLWPAFDSLLAVTVSQEQRSSVFAVRHATLNAGFGIGALVAAAIVDFHSAGTFQLLYLLDAATFLAFVPILIALKGVGGRARPEPAELGPQPGYRAVLRDRAFLRVLGLTILLYGLGYAQSNAAFPVYATGAGGIDATGLAIIFALNTVAVTLLQLPVLRLAQGHRRSMAIALVFALWGATWAVTLIGGHVGGGAAALVVFASAEVIFAFGETLMSPAIAPLVNDLAPDRLRGRYNGVYTLALTTGFILGPLAAGAALGSGHATAFFLALVVACGLSALAALRTRSHLPANVDFIEDVTGA